MEVMTDEHRIAQLDPQERDKILRQLSLVHSSTGHGSYHLLVQALKRQQARPQVLALARTFRCSACEERKRPDPRSRANLKVFTDRWKSIQVDAAFWRNPRDNKQSQFVVLLDEASRFMVTALIPGHKRGISPQEYIEIFEQKWKPYFGVPDVVRSDPEGAWRSQVIQDYFTGDLVFYWRTQILGNEKQSWNRGRYVGPARVLALETRNDEDGRLSPSSVAWLVKGNRIVKVSERRLSQEEHEQFQGAKKVEVDKFIASEALQALPPHLRPNKEQALRMRWILVWKKKEDGSVKPKARAVVLGYQDPDYANRPTFAPTMTRQTRQVLLQWAANHRAEVKKGDVAAAFLQGREFARDLYLIPTPEICTAMNIAPESVVKMRKACYGLVEAPIEWFETMNTFLRSQGLEQLKSDPCCWRLRDPTTGQTVGLVSGHVDDFLFSGLPQNQQWEAAERSIRERFNWGEWEVNDFVQCGVRVRAQKDHSFWLDQEKYVQDIQEINIPKNRRETPKESTTDAEKTELRGLLGALDKAAHQMG
ncbi:Retrovirus-related Pol polyprotein from transposon TNT 1-94 [Includes: Protease [Durusdinium trenchii]|uniref:Retrovirus-related Pol polyprotein from transposon TNT 1-94 n=1 Tax=Durusdinium trenchii TaxID=1381693 RepID=A0ABP0NIV0_9DINO